MKKTRLTKLLSLILCMVLVAAMTLFTTGCGDTSEESNEATTGATDVEGTTGNTEDAGNVLGEGKTAFTFSVTDADGKETVYTINTDKKTVGDALLELDLIAGEDGEYGLYVKTVNGITVDYDKDGKYWAFYIDGEYAMSGVDTTDIEEGATYAFKVE